MQETYGCKCPENANVPHRCLRSQLALPGLPTLHLRLGFGSSRHGRQLTHLAAGECGAAVEPPPRMVALVNLPPRDGGFKVEGSDEELLRMVLELLPDWFWPWALAHVHRCTCASGGGGGAAVVCVAGAPNLAGERALPEAAESRTDMRTWSGEEEG